MPNFEIVVRIPAQNRHQFGAKKEVVLYQEIASNDFFHSTHHSTQVCVEHNKTPIVQSVVAKRDERLVVTDAPFAADALGLQGCFTADQPKKRPLEDDLAMARKVLAGRSVELAELDARLAPVWTAEESIKATLTQTHEGGPTRGLNLSRRQERVSLFKRLDELALKWGKVKTERRFINSEIRTLGRLVDNLARQIEKQRGQHGRKA